MYSSHRASRSELRDETSGNYQTQHRERGTLRHQRGSQVVTSSAAQTPENRTPVFGYELRRTTRKRKKTKEKRETEKPLREGFRIVCRGRPHFYAQNFLNSRSSDPHPTSLHSNRRGAEHVRGETVQTIRRAIPAIPSVCVPRS